LSAKEEIESWLARTLDEPLVKILAEGSHLTRAQLETLLIDVLAEEMLAQNIPYEYKSKLRLLEKGVSRGAFNRTLRQAQRNVVCSIYTVLLLGYLGILETPRLNRYLEMSNQLESYARDYRKIWNELRNDATDKEKLKNLTAMQEELRSTLERLTIPNALSKREASK
jgi:hypothetical protein